MHGAKAKAAAALNPIEIAKGSIKNNLKKIDAKAPNAKVTKENIKKIKTNTHKTGEKDLIILP